MRIEFYSLAKLKRELLKIVGQYLDLRDYQVFFFGSRVTGKGTERSDIDVGIDGLKEIPGEIMAKIREDVENLPTLYKIEVVDFKRVASDFREVALQNTEQISP